MEKFRFLTAGESHGKCLTAIIEGIPADLDIDIDFINEPFKEFIMNKYGTLSSESTNNPIIINKC